MVELAWYAWVYGGSGPPPPPSPVFFLANYQQAFGQAYVRAVRRGDVRVIYCGCRCVDKHGPDRSYADFGGVRADREARRADAIGRRH